MPSKIGPDSGLSLEKEANKMTKEDFLALSIEDMALLLEQDLDCFDDLEGNDNPEITRRLTEAMKETGYQNESLQKRLKEIKREVYEGLESKEAPEWLREFSEEERIELIKNLTAIELTEGCSINCPFCGFEAGKMTGRKISFGDLVYLFKNYGKWINDPLYVYWASEPLDWEEESRNYLDVHEMITFFTGRPPYVATAYPKGKEAVFKKMLEKDYIGRLSVSAHNIQRLIEDGLVRWESDGEEKRLVSDNEELQRILDQGRYLWVNPESELERYQKAGKGFKISEGRLTYGGIECRNGVLLRQDGFYNKVICKPTESNKKGVILRKIDSKKIKEKINLEHLPLDMSEFLQYGVVAGVTVAEMGLGYGRVDEKEERDFFVVLSNFFNRFPEHYYIEYSLDTGNVKKVDRGLKDFYDKNEMMWRRASYKPKNSF